MSDGKSCKSTARSIDNHTKNVNAEFNDVDTDSLTVDQIALDNGIQTFSGATGLNQIQIPDNLADAFSISQGSNDYISMNSSNSTENVQIHKNLYLARTYLSDGTASAPAMAFNNSSSTGLYRIGADDIGISTAGALTMQVKSNVVRCFQPLNPVSGLFATFVDSDNTEAFLVRKDGDAGDVFTVDTINDTVTINGDLTADNYTGNVSSRWNCQIYNNAAESIANNSFTEVSMNTEAYDTSSSSNMADLANNRITIRESGLYLLVGKFFWANATTTDTRRVGIVAVGGTSVARDERSAVSGTASAVTVSTVRQLTTGNHVTLDCLQNDGSALNLGGATEELYSSLSVSYLGST